MNYIFFGTPRLAAIVLKELIAAGFPPVALVCNPDRPTGRKKIITPPPTKLLASEYSLKTILQPEEISEEFLTELREINADFYVVAAYAKILPKELLDIPPKGVIGVHPSLLPKFRGASPIQSAVLSGSKTTGVSLFMVNRKVDNGPVLASKEIPINGRDYLELEKELAESGGKLLSDILPGFMAGEIKPMEQNHSEATFTNKFTSEDGFVERAILDKAQNGENSSLAEDIERKIRALNPEPGVFTIIEGKRVKLLQARLDGNQLKLTRIQKEGGKPVFLT